MRGRVLAILLCSGALHGVEAQAPASSLRTSALVAPEPWRRQDVTVSPAFLASAVLPGAAQYLAGDDRWVAYVAFEAWGWLSYIKARQGVSTAERQYRDLAWQVARRVSAPPRRDSVFTYYEAMSRSAASGAFDTDLGLAGVQPEPDVVTFNGQVWRLARELNFAFGAEPGTPAYQAALAYYVAHAIPPSHAWSWGGSRLEQQAFVRLIGDSDDAFRSSTRYLGLLLANHIVSAVDALVTERLRRAGAEGFRLESMPVRHGASVRWEHGIRYSF